MVKKKKVKELGIIDKFLLPKKKIKVKSIRMIKKSNKKTVGMVLKERKERTLKRISERRRTK